MFLLVIYLDGELLTYKYETYNDAYNDMEKVYKEICNINCIPINNHLYYDDGDKCADIKAKEAKIESYNNKYLFKIFEV